MQRFEQQLLENAHGEDLPHADSMLVILVRGLFSQLKFPYAQFPCTSLSGDQMYDPFWEAVGRLELCGLKVLALTCDGLAANRRLFKLHDVDSRVVHRVSNPYSTDGRYLYFFIDPPHLIKTVRNGWANNKRHLWVSVCAYINACVQSYTYIVIIINLHANEKVQRKEDLVVPLGRAILQESFSLHSWFGTHS